jgi:hypothetical protein
MYDELRYQHVVDGIDILITDGAKMKEIPFWVRVADYTLTALYLATYVYVIVLFL